MDNITHTVKEKMKKVYSFTGTQLLITGVGIIILLSVVTGASAGKGHIKMKNHMMRGNRQEMTQQYDNQGSNREKKQGMMRGKTEPMMNGNQNNQPTVNQEQVTLPSSTTDSGN